MINSATKLPFWHKGRLKTDDDHLAPLDYIQGAGMVNAVGAYEQLVSGRNEPNDVPAVGWDLNHLQESENTQNIYKITLAEPIDKVITATVVWNKHYSNVYPFEPIPEKDANLRLELWAVDPNDPNSNILLDYSDSESDNVEHIYCAADANYTDYEIVVRYSDAIEPNQLRAFLRKQERGHLYGLAWKTADTQKHDSIFWHDLNADGIVNELDFTVLLDNMLSSIKTPENYCYGDINGDGIINSADFQILMQHVNQQADWYTENTPE